MTPGTFLYDENFTFKDGEQGQKIFVVFNNGSSGIYVASKSTSRADRFGIQHGCQVLDRFPNFYLVQGSCCLTESTWIQLDAFYEFRKDELMQKVMSGAIHRIGVLETEQTKELLICASHSMDLTMSQESLITNAIESIKNNEVSEPVQQ